MTDDDAANWNAGWGPPPSTPPRRQHRRTIIVASAAVVVAGLVVGAFFTGRAGSGHRFLSTSAASRNNSNTHPTTTSTAPTSTTTSTTSPLPVVERCRATTSTPYLTGSTGPRFQREPSKVQQTCRNPGAEGIENVTWTSWTADGALGVGTWVRAHMCPGTATPTPNCPPPVQVSVALSVPAISSTGTLVFTKLVVVRSTGSRTAGHDWGAGFA